MPIHLKRLAVLLPLLLTGCGEGIYGAYEATIQTANAAPQVVGIAVFQRDRIIADGQTALVHEWKAGGGTFTALDDNGQRLMQVTKDQNGDLVQVIDQTRVTYKKYEF
ncbi:hypothetical protein [Pseudomonas baetica]|uniref:hypothetical protein n=1 Tax=Pseudomonas baetica TaxID=674054 RepID=UPI002405AE1D|nr:hypothetical protein [Pseudomonas baetica]MDF9779122.1 hypothetical protein [Pseudomonas baetica]